VGTPLHPPIRPPISGAPKPSLGQSRALGVAWRVSNGREKEKRKIIQRARRSVGGHGAFKRVESSWHMDAEQAARYKDTEKSRWHTRGLAGPWVRPIGKQKQMASVTAQGKVFTWWFWPPIDVQQMSDEFVVVAKCCRIRLMGPTLEVSIEGSGSSESSAKTVADEYVEILRKHLPGPHLMLMSEQEWAKRTEPPFPPHMMNPMFRSSRSRADCAKAVNNARSEMLAQEDETLRRCYDYLQDGDSASRPDVAAFAAYKAAEVLIERFGGQRKAVKALGVAVKDAKTAANPERHIPENTHGQPDKGNPLELIKQVIKTYEKHLLKDQGCH
jgi:hypothetical protein